VFVSAKGGWTSTPASAAQGFDLVLAGEYYDVITDRLADTYSGPKDKDGNPTLTKEDIIRASEDEIAKCDFAIVRISNPKNGNPTFTEARGMRDTDQLAINVEEERKTFKYLPISLQYRPYTANSEFVRKESLGGDMIEVIENNTMQLVKENRSYFGKTGIITNESHLDLVLNTAAIAKKTIVALDVSNPMVFNEFEREVDAILVGFGGNRSSHIPDKAFLEVIAGKFEPSGLLPLQMPLNMETVESQFEDVPRDMDCYVDSDGHTYNFAYGLNWSGVIKDDRTAKYDVPPLVGNSPK
jgi:beta-glucosidase